MHEAESDLPTEESLVATETAQLLPVCVGLVSEFLKDRDKKYRAWVLSMVEVLYHVLMGKVRLGPAVLTGAQEYMATHLYHEKGGNVESYLKGRHNLGSVKFDYSGEPIQYMRSWRPPR